MKKVFKSVLCTLVAAAMLAAVSPCAFAEDTGLDGAIAIAKTKLDIPEKYSDFSSRSSEQFGVTDYNLTWSVPESGESIDVTVNSKGDITYMRKDTNSLYRDDMSLPKITAKEATDAALSWLEGVNPSWASQLASPTDNGESVLYSSKYRIEFQREVGGIPVDGDSVSAYVDKVDGSVVSMGASWSYPSEFADISGAISAETAQLKLIENSPLELSYKTAGENSNAVLVYAPKNSYTYINALSGEVVNPAEEYRNSMASVADAVAETAAAGEIDDLGGSGSAQKYSYTEEELAQIAQNEKLLTSEQAMEIFRGIKHIEAETYNLSSCRYYTSKNRSGATKYTVSLSLSRKYGEDKISYMNVALDAESGELKSLYSYGGSYSSEDDGESYDVNAAKSVAVDFAEEYAPNEYPKTKLDESVFEEIEKYEGYIPSFSFERYENDVVFPENEISVDVNSKGIVTRFSKQWDDDVTFESTEGMLSADAAAEKLFEQIPARLSYVDFSSYNSVSLNIIPVYSFGDSLCRISATTGKRLSYDNTEYTEKSAGEISFENLTDISGHYAENAVKALLYFGVISLGEGETEFRPDEAMSQVELLKLVESAFMGWRYSPLSEADGIYSLAKSYSIIKDDEVNSDAPATRIDAAKFIVRALDFGEVAELDGIFDSGFADRADIPSGCEGYVAIAKGLKIVNGDENNNFNSNAPVTRGDAAVMIYNYLSR